jgi:adhesin/invasin
VKTIALKKKVAAIAVASMAMAGVSSQPAFAGNIAASLVESINFALDTAAPTANSAVKAHMGALVGSAAAETDTDTVTFVGYLSTYPTGGFVPVTCDATLDSSGDTDAELWEASVAGNDVSEACSDDTYTVTLDEASDATNVDADVTATASTGVVEWNFIPTVAGTYTLKVWADIDADRVIDFNEAQNEFSITVAADSTLAAGNVVITNTAGTNIDAAGVVYASSSLNSVLDATWTVSQKNAAGADLATASSKSVSFSISGVGSFADPTSGSSTRLVSYPAATYVNSSGSFSVYCDGTAGKAVVSISVGGANVGTKTVVCYGSVATITPTANYSIARAGGYQSGAITEDGSTDTSVTTDSGLDDVGKSSAPAMKVELKDAAGNLVPVVPTVTSSNTAIILNGRTASLIDNGTGDYSSAFGTVSLTYTSATTAKSGDTATLTLSYTNSSGTTVTAAPITIKVGGSVAKEVISTDKSTYNAGEAMTVTITATDSSGNPVFDGATSPAITASKTLGGTFAASVYVGGKKANLANTLFAPATGGTFLLTATGTDAAATKLTASASVTDANAGLLTQIDALNAKIVALNALIAKIMKKLGVK